MNQLKEEIKAEAMRLGFSFIGIAEPRQTPHFESYMEWINDGKNAGLDYLAKEYVIRGRRQPENLLEGVRSVIVGGIHYVPNISLGELNQKKSPGYGWVAAYGCLPDYHQTIKQQFRQLHDFIREMTGVEVKGRIFIDSGPVMEKDFAVQAGLGWIGRNTLLITPEFGSYCLLGCLFIDLDLPPDKPVASDNCNDCEACIKACPTGCINIDRTINAGQCISYQTIENRLDFPDEIKERIGSWVFGCDVCQMVCPFNREAVITHADQLPSISVPVISQKVKLVKERSMDAADFKVKFSATPVSRIGNEIYQRNLLNALINLEDKKE